MFSVPGTPRGKQRPRFWNGRAVTPKETREYEQAIALVAKSKGAQPYEFPCRIEITAVFEPSASWTRKKTQAALEGRLHHTKRPDADNAMKIVLDALNGVAWKDDAQVYDARITKTYGKSAELGVTIVYDTTEV